MGMGRPYENTAFHTGSLTESGTGAHSFTRYSLLSMPLNELHLAPIALCQRTGRGKGNESWKSCGNFQDRWSLSTFAMGHIHVRPPKQTTRPVPFTEDRLEQVYSRADHWFFECNDVTIGQCSPRLMARSGVRFQERWRKIDFKSMNNPCILCELKQYWWFLVLLYFKTMTYRIGCDFC